MILAKEFAESHSDLAVENRAQKVEIELLLTDGTAHPHKGAIDFVNREIDASTGAILVQASFPNPELILRPGQFARVKIKKKVEQGALLVPQRVVSELQGEYSIFVVNAENKIESKRIVIGDSFDDYYIVKEGISEGDKIVFEGLQKVGNGLEVIPEITVFESQFKKQ